jgi:hypothetical protein
MKKESCLLLLLIIVLFGCTAVPSPNKEAAANASQEGITPAQGMPAEENLSKCADTENESKIQCYLSLAIAASDSSVCYKAYALEVQLGRDEKAAQLTEDSCYRALGISEKSLEICNKIELVWIAADCYMGVANSTGNSSICPFLGESSYRAKCYADIALNNKNASICANINEKDEQIEPGATADCYRKVAISMNNAGPCDQIANNAKKVSCYIGVASMNEDLAVCGRLGAILNATAEDAKACEAEVYTRMAINRNDTSICRRIGPGIIGGFNYTSYCEWAAKP